MKCYVAYRVREHNNTSQIMRKMTKQAIKERIEEIIKARTAGVVQNVRQDEKGLEKTTYTRAAEEHMTAARMEQHEEEGDTGTGTAGMKNNSLCHTK